MINNITFQMTDAVRVDYYECGICKETIISGDQCNFCSHCGSKIDRVIAEGTPTGPRANPYVLSNPDFGGLSN